MGQKKAKNRIISWYRMRYALQLDTRNLESLHHVLLKLRPELCPADRSVEMLHVPITAANLSAPPRNGCPG